MMCLANHRCIARAMPISSGHKSKTANDSAFNHIDSKPARGLADDRALKNATAGKPGCYKRRMCLYQFHQTVEEPGG